MVREKATGNRKEKFMRTNDRWVIAIAGVFLPGALRLSGGRRRLGAKVLAAPDREYRRLRFGVSGDVQG